MNEILIQDGDKPELRFRGQLIADSEFMVELNDEQQRKFKLQVFGVEGGGFVSTLQYLTSCNSEKSTFLYEDMDLLKDVENFFFVFEANEVIRDLQAMSRVDREQRMLVYRQIAKVYESSVFRFLDVVRNRAKKLKFNDRVVENAEKPSILRTLGLKR